VGILMVSFHKNLCGFELYEKYITIRQTFQYISIYSILDEEAAEVKRSLFLIICTTVFLYSVILYLPSPLLTEITRGTGWSLGQAGNLMGLFNLATGICTFFTASMVDRFGAQKTAEISLLFAVAGGFMAAAGGTSYYMHCLGRILSGAGFGIMFPVPGTIISEMYEGEKATRMLGIRTTVDFTGCSLSYYITIPVCSLLGSWQYAFAVWGIAAILPLIAMVLLRKAGAGKPGKTEKSIQASGQQEEASWRIALRQKWLWLMAAAMLGINIPLYGFSTYLPAYLETVRGLSVSEASAVTGLIQMAGIFSGTMAGMITEFFGRRKVLSFGALLGILFGGVCVLFFQWLPVISMGTFLIGFSVGAYMIYYSTVPADILGNRYPGVYAASISLVLGGGTIFTALIPEVFQFVLDQGMGIRTALFVFMLPAAVSLVPAAMIKETGPRGKWACQGTVPYPLESGTDHHSFISHVD